MPIAPTVRGLYLCERVEVHPTTRNLTLHGCFRTLVLAGIPTSARPFFIVAYLAGGLGDQILTARVNRLDTMAEVYWSRTPVRFPDRLAEVRFSLRIEQCRFPVPGGYEISLWADRELLAQTPFTVRPLTEEQP
ncbi:MAG TPA: hypothetical protein VFG68_19985 [Fimbriiglobus sp.]|nr:hypothetical protein [Fimbriiglobus sp.]